MLISSVWDNENNRCKRNTHTIKEKKQRQKWTKADRSYSERVRAKWYCCTFKLGFLQLRCKASLNFKSNLEIALSNILKQK